MVVGCDTTLLYAEGTQPAEPDDPDQPAPDEPTVPDAPTGEPLYIFSQVDTQYIELRAFEVGGRWVLPGRDEIQVPFGTKIRLAVEGSGGSRQYVYGWSPEDLMERHDSTASAVSTLRVYENSEVQAMIRDTVTGCQAVLQLRIEMQDKIGDVPNAFSPNGDGINDVFMKGTDLVIYNRFGMELFRSTRQEGWDGTFKGATVAPGDYLYVVTIRKDGKTYTKKGTVTVFTK
ncbi:MAG: gliding motility-associated C-terminal domain-containing protein [Bacteroidales bacterium]|nr:gliding motility-associated C-terminal domain-containing protein [Bacteroidales bacterium]